MKTLHESEFFVIQFDEAKRLYKDYWKPESENMTPEQMEQEILKATEFTVSCKPDYYFTDNSERKYTFGLEAQAWVAEKIHAACLEGGVKKYALILPTGFVEGLSTQQAVETVGELPFEFKFVESEEEALNWFDV